MKVLFLIKFKFLLVSVLFTFGWPVSAGSQVGKVDYVIVRASDGLVFFGLIDGVKSGSPACATNSYWMIRDENSEAGKKQYAMLLTAQASGRNIEVTGMNTCNRWSDGEDVNWLRLRAE
ncbi:hypothetical protein [Arsukibacterium sp.]|uniref:hypothetical protein n=1 Tax=Arsukibacterium sp. TaxID=1977258 RepID=UPI0035681008